VTVTVTEYTFFAAGHAVIPRVSQPSSDGGRSICVNRVSPRVSRLTSTAFLIAGPVTAEWGVKSCPLTANVERPLFSFYPGRRVRSKADDGICSDLLESVRVRGCAI
jgi:hypothetical protein